MRKPKRVRKETAATQADAPGLRGNWIILLVLGVTFLAYANTITHGFAYDDQTFILQNEVVQSASISEAISKIPVVLTKELWFYRVLQDKDPNKDTGPTTPYYRPMFVFYQMGCWLLFGASASGWHVANILVHLLVVYFAFLILQRITGNRTLAAIASLVFAVHPLRSESVAWICGISDPYLGIFLLPCFYLYMRYREQGNRKQLAGALALFLLAAFAKEPAVALPIFIVAYELFAINLNKSLMERVKPAVVYGGMFLAISAFYFGMRLYALGFLFNNSNFKSYSTTQTLSTIPLVIWKYIGLLLFPVNLSLFHETILVNGPLDVRFILPALGLVALAAGLWPLRKSVPARFAILWFTINLLPVLNLSAFTQEFLVQERYVYLPSIGFSLLVAMGLANIPVERWFTLGSRRTARTLVVALVVLALAGKTLAQNTVWKDDMTLWTYGVEAAPDQPMTHYVLGHKYINQQDSEKAIGAFEAYVQLKPNNLIVVNNLAAAHLVTFQNQAAVNPAAADRAHLDRAAALCEKGLGVDNRQPTLWDTLGTVYTFDTSLRNYDRAIGCFSRALQLQPDNGMVNFHMGATLAKQGNDEGAFRYLETARQLQPDLADVYKFLAYLYRSKGQVQLAIDNLSEYLRRRPNAFDAQRISKDVRDLQAQLQDAPRPQS
jgi:protein O-mannosyl-transferase